MSSIKIVLRKKKNKDGTYPLAIRITKDRNSSFIHLGQNLEVAQWDPVKQRVKKSHQNSTRLNNLILSKLAEYNDTLLDLTKQKTDTSSRAIKRTIKGVTGATFKVQAATYLGNLRKSGKYNRISAEEPRVNRFLEFIQVSDISFKEITVPLLNTYKAYLKGSRNISERTIVNHLVVVRSIFNQAIKGHLVDRKYYPFGSDKIQIKFPDSIKIGLVPEEVKRLEELELTDPRLNHSRNLWLFAFYFAGMRVSDVFRLRWSEFKDGRLYYAMGKNGKVDSLKAPERALKILEQYQPEKDESDLVFPELKSLPDLSDDYFVQRRIKTKLAATNILLKKVALEANIDKKLTMHIPRHSFGNISGDKISIQMLQKLYRHSSITTTIGYQANFIHKDADEALNSVITF